MLKHIPVFCATDENYAPFTTTMMYSVLSNTKSFVDFYVLDGGITDDSKDKIAQSIKKFKNKTITYFSTKEFDLYRFPNIRHYSINCFSRYFIPIVAPHLSKVIYLDVDIIVSGDINDLYSQDLGKYPLGAVLEDFYPGNYQYLKEKIYPKFKAGDKYFNSGVLLFNIQYFIKNNLPQELINLTVKLYDKLSCPDQDIFNIVFENNFKVLDYKFNYMPDHIRMLKSKHPGIKVNPVIIHYTGPKPWKAKSLKSKEFNDILKQTLFCESVKQKYAVKSIKASSIIRYYLFGFIPLIKIEKE